MRKFILPLVTLFAAAIVGCDSSNSPPPSQLNDESRASIARMESRNSALQNEVDSAYGYVIFPDIGAAAVGVGAAGGKGYVYKGGQVVGWVNLAEGSVGAQIGGESYAELIVFQDEKALNRLMNNSFEFGADANATVVKAGAAISGNFANGVKIFVMSHGGLMAAANVNGQKFHFTAVQDQGSQNAQPNQNNQ